MGQDWLEGKEMKVGFYLAVNSGGSVRAVKRQPDLAQDEICIYVTLELPERLFDKPSLQATLTIPDEVAMPASIPVDVKSNVKEAIEGATGMNVYMAWQESGDRG
jgi:hypothetical protein